MKAICHKGGDTTANFCPDMIPSHTLSIDIDVGEKNPTVQISFLKSYSDNMGTVKIWIDDKTEESALLSSKWDLPYSVTKIATISRDSLGEISFTSRGDSFVFPSLTLCATLYLLSTALHCTVPPNATTTSTSTI